MAQNGDLIRKKVDRLEALLQLLTQELDDLKRALENPQMLEKRLKDARYKQILQLDRTADELLDELVRTKKQLRDLR